jgi:cytoplasmic iron level regulating protein YaaA (DUF328/UPF0246 family)
MIVGLVGCASQKLKREAPARELYVSTLFKKASAYAEAHSDIWFILSAKHGLVHPDQMLEPYDVKLGTKDAGPIHAWGDRVRFQLNEWVQVSEVEEVLLLAGGQYAIAAGSPANPAPWTVTDPMKGMGIGQRLQFLTNN